jgi:hypothetical protein
VPAERLGEVQKARGHYGADECPLSRASSRSLSARSAERDTERRFPLLTIRIDRWSANASRKTAPAAGGCDGAVGLRAGVNERPRPN